MSPPVIARRHRRLEHYGDPPPADQWRLSPVGQKSGLFENVGFRQILLLRGAISLPWMGLATKCFLLSPEWLFLIGRF